MNTTPSIERFSTRLIQRKDQVFRTLHYVEEQRKQVEKQKEWQDAIAKARRQHLLDYLSGWYRREINQVEKALARIHQNRYGSCMSCNSPIESEYLETFPEAEHCASCRDVQERMEWR
jgi:RNA polymerase-binding transcription factor DksA